MIMPPKETPDPVTARRSWRAFAMLWTVVAVVNLAHALVQQNTNGWRWLFVALCAANAIGGWIRAHRTGQGGTGRG